MPELIASRMSTVLNPPRESMSRTVVKPASRSTCAFASAISVRFGGRIGLVEIQVDVPIDHARKHGRGAEVEHGRAGGNLHPRADLGDALALTTIT